MSPTCLLHCALFILSISTVFGASEGVIDKIKAGLQNAKNYLETAREIADLVSKSLKPKQAQKKRGDEADFSEKQERQSYEPTNLMSTFFRLLGLDSKKVTAVAVNSFVFFAQMISELFKVRPKVERATNVDDSLFLSPLRLITGSDNENVQNLLQQAYDEDLPNRLIEQTDGFDSSCIKLLLCKTSPVIMAAQRTLKTGSLNGQRAILNWMPSKDEFEEFSDNCDDKYSECDLNLAP